MSSRIMDLPNTVVCTGVEQDSFRQGCFSSVNVCSDSNVSDKFEIGGHLVLQS